MLTRASGFVAGPPGCWSSGRISPGFVMSSIGTTTWRSSALRAPASTIVTSRSGPDAAEEPGDRLERALGGAEPDPLRRRGALAAGDQVLQPLEGQREVGAALRAGDRVDLVDDHVLDAARGPRAPGS